jgi:hypothetical protein
LVWDSSLFGQMVVGPRHSNAFRTFGDGAIVTGYWPGCPPSVDSQGAGTRYRCKGANNGRHGRSRRGTEIGPVTKFCIAVFVKDDLDLTLARWAQCGGQIGPGARPVQVRF